MSEADVAIQGSDDFLSAKTLESAPRIKVIPCPRNLTFTSSFFLWRVHFLITSHHFCHFGPTYYFQLSNSYTRVYDYSRSQFLLPERLFLSIYFPSCRVRFSFKLESSLIIKEAANSPLCLVPAPHFVYIGILFPILAVPFDPQSYLLITICVSHINVIYFLLPHILSDYSLFLSSHAKVPILRRKQSLAALLIRIIQTYISRTPLNNLSPPRTRFRKL